MSRIGFVHSILNAQRSSVRVKQTNVEDKEFKGLINRITIAHASRYMRPRHIKLKGIRFFATSEKGFQRVRVQGSANMK